MSASDVHLGMAPKGVNESSHEFLCPNCEEGEDLSENRPTIPPPALTIRALLMSVQDWRRRRKCLAIALRLCNVTGTEAIGKSEWPSG
ncbi:hypothetical protein REMIM1_CH00841 [Rhizobium etli bv. mimosae str. Mim1]|nr:hypothetical protein REMIM1_CH00841 [Rhizobium etli bv. mimosae str. Mim1]